MMQTRISTWTLRSVAIVAVLGFSGQVFAAKDRIFPSSASALVGGSASPLTSNFPTGADGSTTFDNDLTSGSNVVVNVTWSIDDRSGGGANTDYSRTVTFVSATTVGGSPVSVAAIANCTVTGNTSTCSTPVSFTAPAAGMYAITVTAADAVPPPNNVDIQGRVIAINFTTVDPEANQVDTKLTVDRKCVALRQASVDLTATLEVLDGGAKIPGAEISYFIDPELDSNGVPTVPSIGSATTDANGVASLAYSPAALGVGDYSLYAEFAGDALYNASNDSDTLGVSYVFGGFRPPVNADGTSIFGGRVIPVKIKLLDATGAVVSEAAPLVWIVSYGVSGMGEVVENATSVSAADTGNIMRYAADEQQYIYNLDATDLPNGTYKIRVSLGDSATCSPGPYEVPITIQRKGGKK